MLGGFRKCEASIPRTAAMTQCGDRDRQLGINMGFLSNKNWLACGEALTLILATPVFAQSRDFNIPTQPAAKAIPEFARQAGVQIVAPGKQFHGVTTRAVKGQMDARDALQMMLEGTGITVLSDDGKTITLKGGHQPAARSANGTSARGRVLNTGTGQYLRNAEVTV